MPSQAPIADGISTFVLEIARVIKELREERGMTVSELAAEADIARSTLERLEGGKANSLMGTVHAIAYALEIHSYILCQMAAGITPTPIDGPLRKPPGAPPPSGLRTQ